MTTFTTSQPSSLFLETFQLGTLLPIMSILEYLDEPSLSNMTCAMLRSHDANDKDWSMQLTQCFDEAWIRLAVRKCRKSSNSRADGNKGFPTAKIAKTFLRVRKERISNETIGCANRGCPNPGNFRCSACRVAMYCRRYVVQFVSAVVFEKYHNISRETFFVVWWQQLVSWFYCFMVSNYFFFFFRQMMYHQQVSDRGLAPS